MTKRWQCNDKVKTDREHKQAKKDPVEAMRAMGSHETDNMPWS